MLLTNAHGERVELSPLGAAIAGIFVRDGRGRVSDVSVDEGGSAGKTIGRFANRIAKGRFTLDGRVYRLATNDGPNTLHGGPDGFAKRVWNAGPVRATNDSHGSSAEFTLQSDDGDQGFPGSLSCSVVYTFDDAGALRIDYRATTDAPTVINLTNHVYFNFSGAPTIARHRLRIAAAAYTPVDAALIPTGRVAPVAGTTRDFRAMRPIGDEAYDCNYVVDGWDGTLRAVAELLDEESGRKLSVLTTEPGLQLYTGKRSGVALETQHFPDSPNHPDFPSTALRPGQTFSSTTIYRFESRKSEQS
ncbi:MAG TPA: aldose epimerase family protein [Candidatus Baltobacteraceae bacterium]|nr:aldose epimerase family protein [Candidatus Baltobacteraceae bacterium]